MKQKNPRINSGGFGMVSREVMADPELSMKEKGLYAYLATYANGSTNELTVSVNRMCAELGVTQATVKRSLKLLEQRNVIQRVNTGALRTRKTVLLK